MNTIFLVPDTWDLTIDASGNIAMAAAPYAQAQDATSNIKLFSGELWYDTTQGIPYWQSILGYLPPISLLKSAFVSAALEVPGVTKAVCYLSSIVGRKISGQVQITNSSGQTSASVI
jgi:hypothetical protein